MQGAFTVSPSLGEGLAFLFQLTDSAKGSTDLGFRGLGFRV